jgi:hypothetical protein
MKDELKKLIGSLPPSESGWKKQMRFHQGWWRAFVLAEEEGDYPNREGKRICNTIQDGRASKKNFLSPNIIQAVEKTIEERRQIKAGMLDEDRLFNNLLSSQPLCFNFFGEFKLKPELALSVLQQFWPDLTEIIEVKFEYAPAENYLKDKSAFDVAFVVMAGEQRGLIGLESKYADSFSATEYKRDEYQHIYDCDQRKEAMFTVSYEKFTGPQFNQLFRNQLIAAALVQNREFVFVYTGLFCHHRDEKAISIGADFKRMLRNGKETFQVITYQDYIEKLQRSEISWELRELSMMLWARYCGLKLSEEAL